MVKEYGETTWTICIATTITGGTAQVSNPPVATGSWIYLQTNQARFSCRYMQKIGVYGAGMTFSTKNGKRQQIVEISKATIPTGKYTDVNKVTNFFMENHQIGDPPIILFAVRLEGAQNYYKEFYDSGGTAVLYLEGYVTDWSVDDKGYGDMTVKVKFAECSI